MPLALIKYFMRLGMFLISLGQGWRNYGTRIQGGTRNDLIGTRGRILNKIPFTLEFQTIRTFLKRNIK